MKHLMILILTAIICHSSFALAGDPAFIDTRYFTGRINPIDNTRDTITVISFRTLPEYMKPVTVDITYYCQYDNPDGINFKIIHGAICKCKLDKLEQHVPGSFHPGDSVQASFTLTPLVVGLFDISVSVQPSSDNKYWHGGSIIIALDENGKAVNYETNGWYGSLGLLPELISDSLIFIDGCYFSDKPNEGKSGSRGFSIKATLKPPFKEGQQSLLHFDITSYHDFDYGVEFVVTGSEQFEIIVNNTSGWDRPVMQGEELSLELLVKAIMPGEGRIGLSIYGFRNEPIISDPRLARRSGSNKKTLRAELMPTFIIDESLSILAYNRHFIESDEMQGIEPIIRKDQYRMKDIKLLRSRGVNLRQIKSHKFDEKWKTHRNR